METGASSQVIGRRRPRAIPRAFDAWQRARYFPALDGVRALSVLLVVTWHVRGHHLDAFHGYVGVTVFFVLSGFLITTLALREERRRGALNLRAFYIRRASRILPLYVLVLGAYCVLVYGAGTAAQETTFGRALPYYATYLQEIPRLRWPGVSFTHSWSLGIEEKFYLFWPLVAFILLRRFRARVVLTLALLALFLVLPVVPSIGPYLGGYAAILGGCLMALLLDHPVWYARLQPMSPPAYLARALGHPMLVWIGQRSYGIYLVHVIGLSAANRVIPESLGAAGDLLTFPLALLVTFPLCALLHRVVEQPMIDQARARTAGQRVSRAA